MEFDCDLVHHDLSAIFSAAMTALSAFGAVAAAFIALYVGRRQVKVQQELAAHQVEEQREVARQQMEAAEAQGRATVEQRDALREATRQQQNAVERIAVAEINVALQGWTPTYFQMAMVDPSLDSWERRAYQRETMAFQRALVLAEMTCTDDAILDHIGSLKRLLADVMHESIEAVRPGREANVELADVSEKVSEFSRAAGQLSRRARTAYGAKSYWERRGQPAGGSADE